MKKMTTDHPALIRARATAQALGSTATTTRGIVQFLRNKPAKPKASSNVNYVLHTRIDHAKKGDAIQLSENSRTGYRWHTLMCNAAGDRAGKAIGTGGHRSNVSIGNPCIYGHAHQSRTEAINYKGKFKGYHGSYLYWDYQSAIGITQSGRSAIVIIECKVVRRILAPSGMRFDLDANGILLRRVSDGMDYHPTSQDWHSPKFSTRCRAAMAANYKRRMDTKRAEKKAAKDKAEAARMDRLFMRDLPTVRVTLADSRAAGNCVEGSLAFAERKLHIPREEILAGGHLFSVPATRLLSAVNGDKPRVEAAVRRAWMRETAVSI